MTETVNDTQIKLSITGQTRGIRRVIIEPWGLDFSVEADDVLVVVGDGPQDGACFGVEAEGNDLIIIGWPGSTVSVSRSGTILLDGSKLLPCF